MAQICNDTLILENMKIYSVGNYIHLEATGASPLQDAKGRVVVTTAEDTPTGTSVFVISSPNIGVVEVTPATTTDANGVAYSVETWTSFYTENTGFNPAAGGSAAEIAADLATHEANSSAHNLGSKAGVKGNVLVTNPVGTLSGQYATITAALASITNSDTDNRYVIECSSAAFVEPDTVDLSAHPYVSVVGSSINTTTISCSQTGKHIFKIGEYNEISFLTIAGSTTGFAGVYASNSGYFSQLHKMSFNSCDIGILIENTTVDTEFYGEYIDFSGVFSHGIKIVNSGAGSLFVNAENCYSFSESGLVSSYHIEGANAKFELATSGNQSNGTGVGVTYHSGAQVNVIGGYFRVFGTGISCPNTGATPIGFFMGVRLELNTTDVNIAHITAQGFFDGAADNPVISVNPGATFGIRNSENLLGNKKEVYYDPYSIAPLAVTTPTVAAALTVNQSSVTGLIALSYSGTADQNASMNFRVPKDYLSGGRFKISWSTSSTSANNVYFAPILSVKSLGDSLITQTETLTPQTIAAGRVNLRQETGFFTPTTAFVKGQLGVLRISRLATNAADTFTGALYVNGVVFEYNSNS